MKFVSISSLQKTTKPMLESSVVCVLKNNEPVFYTISNKKMDLLKPFINLIGDNESELINCIFNEMTGYDKENFNSEGIIDNRAFSRIVLSLAFNFTNMENLEDIIRSLEV